MDHTISYYHLLRADLFVTKNLSLRHFQWAKGIASKATVNLSGRGLPPRGGGADEAETMGFCGPRNLGGLFWLFLALWLFAALFVQVFFFSP